VERKAEHIFQLEVTYPSTSKVDLASLSTMILQDRHDLIKALRDPSGYDGHDGDASAQFGLWSRVRRGDELTRDQNNFTLRQRWHCLVREEE
jgi:hypothetical protein